MMNEQTVSVPIEIKAADFADLQAWARLSGHEVPELLEDAVRHYMEYMRAEHAMMEEARKGPFYTLEEVQAHLAELRHARAQAAE